MTVNWDVLGYSQMPNPSGTDGQSNFTLADPPLAANINFDEYGFLASSKYL